MPAVVYSDEYIEQVFYLWYKNNKMGGAKLISIIPENEKGMKPNPMTLSTWIKERGWMERADALDAEVSLTLDRDVISARKEMYRKNVEVAEELVAKGRAYILANPLDDSNAALRAIGLGVDILRSDVGKAEFAEKVALMSDTQITKELERLIGKTPQNEEFFDAEDVEDITEEDANLSNNP